MMAGANGVREARQVALESLAGRGAFLDVLQDLPEEALIEICRLTDPTELRQRQAAPSASAKSSSVCTPPSSWRRLTIASAAAPE